MLAAGITIRIQVCLLSKTASLLSGGTGYAAYGSDTDQEQKRLCCRYFIRLFLCESLCQAHPIVRSGPLHEKQMISLTLCISSCTIISKMLRINISYHNAESVIRKYPIRKLLQKHPAMPVILEIFSPFLSLIFAIIKMIISKADKKENGGIPHSLHIFVTL